MKFSLRAVADALGVDATALPDAMITGWSVDSRTVEPGDLFFALRGAVNDGHAHIELPVHEMGMGTQTTLTMVAAIGRQASSNPTGQTALRRPSD